MDYLTILFDFLNVLDSKNILKEKWNILTDKNEYKGTRFFAFLSVFLLVILYFALISIIIFLIYCVFND